MRFMTPVEHRERAEELTAAADQLFDVIEATPDSHDNYVKDADWRLLEARIRLADLHLGLSRRAPTPKPAATPPLRPSGLASGLAFDPSGGVPGPTAGNNARPRDAPTNEDLDAREPPAAEDGYPFGDGPINPGDDDPYPGG